MTHSSLFIDLMAAARQEISDCRNLQYATESTTHATGDECYIYTTAWWLLMLSHSLFLRTCNDVTVCQNNNRFLPKTKQ